MTAVDADGVTQGTCTVPADANGGFGGCAINGLADGTYKLRATSTDAAGNTGTSDPVTVTVDGTHPAQPTTDLAPASDTGSSNTDNITNDDTPTFTGQAEPGSTVSIFADGGPSPVCTTTADAQGAYSCTLPTALADGTYSITATSTDAAGNTSPASEPLQVTIDTAGPSTSITSGPANDSTINTNAVTFEFSSAAPDVVRFECRLNGPGQQQGTFAPCTSPQSYSNLAPGTYTFEVRAVDRAGNTGPAETRTFTITAQNRPPTTTQADGPYTIPEEGTLTADGQNGNPPGVLANDSDPDGDPLRAQLVRGPQDAQGNAAGQLTLNDDGTFTYTPPTNFNGSVTFIYKACDNAQPQPACSADRTVTIDVTPVNDPPVANSDDATTGEDTPVDINVLRNDTDPDGNALTVASFTQPNNGTVTRNANGTLKYTPKADFNGADSFTYTVSDGYGGTATATVNITVTSAPTPTTDCEATPGSGKVIKGTDGNDALRGTPGDDTIIGFGGDDAIYGRGGNDTILGDAGNDAIASGGGNDVVCTGSGNNAVHSNGGNDRVFGGSSHDAIYGGDGDDVINGGDGGSKALSGGSGNDTIRGGEGRDAIDGGSGRDNVYGESERDALNVRDGAPGDSADGGSGTDACSSDRGDQLTGCP